MAFIKPKSYIDSIKVYNVSYSEVSGIGSSKVSQAFVVLKFPTPETLMF